MKRILIFVALLALACAGAAALDDTVYLDDETDQASVNLSVTLAVNHSVYISLVQHDQRLSYLFPSQVDFTGAVMNITFNVIKETVFAENETINATFNFSSDLNNDTFLYTIIARISVQDTLEQLVQDSLEIVNGDYVINISYNRLPKSDILEYNITGKEGETLEISCSGSWLVCPDSQVFDSSGRAMFEIGYTVPAGVDLGSRTSRIDLSSGNLSLHTDVVFNINEPEILLMRYSFGPECYTDLASAIDCMEESEEYGFKRTQQIMSLYKDLLTNKTCPAPANHTEYIFSGKISEQVALENARCRADRDLCYDREKSLQDQLTLKNDQVTKLQADLEEVRLQLIRNNTKESQELIYLSAKLTNESNAVKSKATAQVIRAEKDAHQYRKNTVGFVFMLLFVPGAIVGIILYFRSVSRRKRCNP